VSPPEVVVECRGAGSAGHGWRIARDGQRIRSNRRSARGQAAAGRHRTAKKTSVAELRRTTPWLCRQGCSASLSLTCIGSPPTTPSRKPATAAPQALAAAVLHLTRRQRLRRMVPTVVMPGEMGVALALAMVEEAGTAGGKPLRRG